MITFSTGMLFRAQIPTTQEKRIALNSNPKNRKTQNSNPKKLEWLKSKPGSWLDIRYSFSFDLIIGEF